MANRPQLGEALTLVNRRFSKELSQNRQNSDQMLILKFREPGKPLLWTNSFTELTKHLRHAVVSFA